jgi:hypothetical protein
MTSWTKAGISESKMTSIARLWLGKRVSTETKKYATKESMETVIYMWSVSRLYKGEPSGF